MSTAPEHGPAGRWGGRLTQRPLPERDPTLDALSSADRATLAAIWQTRAAMERRVADSFEVVRSALERRGADASMIELAARAIDDEYRHAELSRLVASRFAGRELAPPARLPLDVPKHKGASPELRDTLHVVGQCMLNETTAAAYLECCAEHATGPLAKAALRELLSDEIEHGRVGWSYLASVPPGVRAQVGPWLLPMAYLNLQIWRRETPDDGRPRDARDALTAQGAPPAIVLHEALLGALRDLIVPGLRELGIDTHAIDAWLAAGADTSTPPVELLGS